MEDRDLQCVLQELEVAVIIRILKGADEEARAKIFNNMSKSAAADIKKDLEEAHGIGEAEISMAKSKLIEVVQKLSANGSINTAWGKK
jgi:flagellar motor switch protein FliG